MKCRWCGGALRTRSKITAIGWVLILAGLLLSPTLIALVLVPVGYFSREKFVECRKHGRA